VQDSQSNNSQIPSGATPIQMEELFQAIGELYVQVRILQRTIQRLSSGTLEQKSTTTPP
jgi:hypothetical protein